ncbi:MAG TPA: hypothetical protein VFQ83_08655 [Candidatus Udaeobacter sp.]|jgi:hypothetical protein|nr:hypothetical protein [Candidatus Udaeobacter sp.]
MKRLPDPRIATRPRKRPRDRVRQAQLRLFNIAFLSLCLLTGSLTVFPAPTLNAAIASVTPLTYANAVSFFRAAKLRATEVQPRCAIFFDGKWRNANAYDYCVIMVENSDEDVQVTFYLTDAHQMNWVTEFLDSPFFSRNEKERLFQLMNTGSEIRGQTIGRFRVDFHHWQPRHADILVFSFTPIRAAG